MTDSVKMPFFTQLAHHFLPEVILASAFSRSSWSAPGAASARSRW